MEKSFGNLDKEVDSESSAQDWFAELTPEKQKEVMDKIKNNFIANSSFRRKTSKMYFQEIDGKLKVVGLEGDLAKPKE